MEGLAVRNVYFVPCCGNDEDWRVHSEEDIGFVRWVSSLDKLQGEISHRQVRDNTEYSLASGDPVSCKKSSGRQSLDL